MSILYTKTFSSPVGKLRLVASDRGLRYVGFDNSGERHAALEGDIKVSETHKILVDAENQLADYFSCKRQIFDLPLELKGTVFQQKAWRALQKIPYAHTKSYGEQAVMVGDKNKARAVGMANNRNPISIIIPCHRVIGANGALVGYGGGLKRKEWLLKFEKSGT